MSARLVALIGRSGVGKDEVARWLVECRGFKRVAVADHLKDVTGLAFGLTREQLWGSGRNEVDERWSLTPRQMYQQLGDALRTIHPAALLKPFCSRLESVLKTGTNVVVSDVRMPSEADLVRQLGGGIWAVRRKDRTEFAGMEHETETALDVYPADVVLQNDSTLEELHRSIDAALVSTS